MLSAKGRGSRPTGVKEATVLFHAALGRGSCTKGRGVGRGQAAETAGMEGEGTTGAGRPAWGGCHCCANPRVGPLLNPLGGGRL